MKFLNCTQNRLKTLTLSFMFLTATAIFAQWSKYPMVNTPVCQESDDQLKPDICSDGAGGTIITWYDKRTGNDYDIFAQRLDAMGNPQWTADGITVASLKGDQIKPVICPDGNGGAFISWIDASSSDGIYAQRIDASGTIQYSSSGVEICSPRTGNKNVRIVYDNSGYAIIAWEDTRNGTADIYAQRIGGSGKKGGIQWSVDGIAVCAESNEQRAPRLTMDVDFANVIITWEDARNSKKATIYDIYCQKVDLSGTDQWTTNGVAICNGVNDQLLPSIVSDDSGGAIIAWHDIRGLNYDLYAQRIDATGTVMWSVDGIGVSGAAGNQMFAEITSDEAHGAIVTWIDTRATGGTHVYAQRIHSSGTPMWTTNGVAICTSGGGRSNPMIISNQSGGAIIAWSDMRGTNYDIYAQNISSAGSVQWTNNGVQMGTATNDQTDPAIVTDNFGGAFLSWSDKRGTNADIYSQNILRDGGLGIVPEITVRGNNQVILDGDNSPVTGDNTEFGSVTTLTPITKKFKIFNTGNKDLSITNVYTTGTHKLEFVPKSMSFPQTIVPYDSIEITVIFSAVSVGISNATLNIDNDDSNESVYNFAIRATFKAAEIDIKGNNTSITDGDITPDFSDSTDFGKIRMNTSITNTFTIVNAGTDTLKITNIVISGTNSGDFSFPSVTYPRKLGPNKTMTLPVTFLPSATGLRKATITVSSNDPNEATYDFSIIGNAVIPAINVKGNNSNITDGDLSPGQVDFTDFGKVNIAQQKSVAFKIFNTGSEVLSITNIYVGGTSSSDFTAQAMTFPQPVAVGDSMEFTVNFAALGLGVRDAELMIDSDDDGKPTYNFAITGNAISQEINVKGNGKSIAGGDMIPAPADNTGFGTLSRNGSKINRFYVINPGTDVLSVTGITLTGANSAMFSLGTLTPASPIPAGDSAYFEVTFNPTSDGLKMGVISIASNDADESVYEYALSGTAISSKIGVKGKNVAIADGSATPTAADNTEFGSVEMPGSIMKSYKIYNTGTDVVNISNISVSGANAAEFTVAGMTFPKTIAPGDSLSLDVNFTPTVEGVRTATITILSNDMDIPTYDFNVKGTSTKKKVGLSEDNIANAIVLYPNPANSEVFVSLPEGMASAGVSIMSADGKTILQQVAVSGAISSIDVSGLSVGVYMITMESNGKLATRKLIINR
jgi:hypothetical protein